MLLVLACPAPAWAQLVVTFDTTPAEGRYEPRNVVAVWVETPEGAFVRTLSRWADRRRQYLRAWNAASSGNVVDAVTGATFSNHGTRTVTWDYEDAAGDLVPDGRYVVRMELADSNATTASVNNQGMFMVDKTTSADTIRTAGGGFENVLLDYTPGEPLIVRDAGTTLRSDSGASSVEEPDGGRTAASSDSGGASAGDSGRSPLTSATAPGAYPPSLVPAGCSAPPRSAPHAWGGVVLALVLIALLRARARTRALVVRPTRSDSGSASQRGRSQGSATLDYRLIIQGALTPRATAIRRRGGISTCRSDH